LILAILQALVAIPKIGNLIKILVEALIVLRTEAQRKELESATIQLNKAKTKEERREAIKRWSSIVSG